METEDKPILDAPTENANMTESRKGGLGLPGAIVIAGLIIGGAIFMNKTSGFSANTEVNPLDLVAEVSSDDVVRGDAKADITIIEYADFSCHFCAQYHPTLQQIVSESDGNVRWAYRHLPIFNKEAAIASSCVAKLGGNEAFWSYADMLYLNTDKFSADFYESGAEDLGIEVGAYNACLGDESLKSKIDREFTQARLLLGFNATPYTVIIDKQGRKFSFAGALPYADLVTAIEGLAK
jgi:protein-disulfide isomerase